MKRQKLKMLALAGAFGLPPSVLPLRAQMNNVVEVESSYTPVVRDANKVNVLPEAEKAEARHYDVRYDATAVPAATHVFQPVWAAGSDAAVEGCPRGFATLGGGSHGNLNLRGAYGVKIAPGDLLDIDLSLRGHNGRAKDGGPEGWMSRFYTARGSVAYGHELSSSSSLLVRAEVESQVFNHLAGTWMPAVPQDYTDKQHNTLGAFSAGVTPYSAGAFSVGGKLAFLFFNQKYRHNYFAADAKNDETQLAGELNLGYSLSGSGTLGLDLGARSLAYGCEAFEANNSFSVAPHYDLRSGQLSLRLGATVGFNTGLEKKTRLAPDVRLACRATPALEVFASATGGEVANDFRHFAQMTPYWQHAETAAFDNTDGSVSVKTVLAQLRNQFDVVRAAAGVSWNIADGLYALLYGGYDVSKNRAELSPDGRLLQADGSLFHLNADVRYDYRDVFALGVRTQFNGWATDDDADGGDAATDWRPNTDIRVDAAWRVVPALSIGADCTAQTFSKGVSYRRANIFNLGLSASYTLPVGVLREGERLSVYGRCDNLLNKRYEPYLGHPGMGTNFLAGVALTF